MTLHRLLPTLAVALAASTPAAAHTGAHMHPHGIDGAWLALTITALIAGAVGFALGRLK